MKTTRSMAVLCAGVMMAMAHVATAFPIVTSGTLPVPPVTPQDQGRSGYQGSGNDNAPWPNQLPPGSGPNQSGLMAGSSYNPATHLLTLNNVRVETNTKHLWVRVITDQMNGYNPPGGGAQPGQQADAGRPAGSGSAWGVCTAPNATPSMTGASWGMENFAGANFLVLYMTWDITPQPGSETVNLSGIAAGLNNGKRITGIQAVSVCTPTVPAPGALALAGLGGLMVARRRRVHE